MTEVTTFLWATYPIAVIIAIIIGASKGRFGFGLLWGLLAGWLGVLIAALAASHIKCPYCRGTIDKSAVVCRHCSRELTS